MVVLVKRPRAVLRDVLSDDTQRQYLSNGRLSKVDTILAVNDDDWTSKQFNFMLRCLADIDDEQCG